ncbi:folate-binding protein 1 [Arachis stenosperma]|uniref:folate-binding protein 1 n=1 Tax=Arachis stenosperma TaxID=217475 RepID=UPI0025ACE26B|nr:folate-binding protein 1 [Arachis stenosperma]
MVVVVRLSKKSQCLLGPKNFDYGFLLFLLFFNLFLPYSSGKPSGVCVSQGGRFPAFKSEGYPPRKGPKDLTLCRVFRKNTCCDISHTHPALLAVRKLASTGEAGHECLYLWEMLECAICDPHVGTQPGPPLICASFCERIYKACSNAYFSMDVKTQLLAPCGVNDFVCGRAAEWVSNGTDLCVAAGFRVKPSDMIHAASEETLCFGDMASLNSVADSWKASQFDLTEKADFQQWVRKIPFIERVSWAIGGMVLTAGLVFISKRKSHSQRHKLAAIRRTARKLEGRMSDKPSSSQENRKRN